MEEKCKRLKTKRAFLDPLPTNRRMQLRCAAALGPCKDSLSSRLNTYILRTRQNVTASKDRLGENGALGKKIPVVSFIPKSLTRSQPAAVGCGFAPSPC